MEQQRISVDGREFVLADCVETEERMDAIAAAAGGVPGWVTIPTRGSRRPRVLITSLTDCIVETVELVDD